MFRDFGIKDELMASWGGAPALITNAGECAMTDTHHTILIPLSQHHPRKDSPIDKFAIIDFDDYSIVSKYKWQVSKGKNGLFYARHSAATGKSFRMHRLILNVPKGMDVDHHDHNGLNNRRSNLRICTNTQNQANRRKTNNTTSSKFKGVGWHSQSKTWRARISLNKKDRCLGNFLTEIEAALAYNEAALKHFGEFAKLNEV